MIESLLLTIFHFFSSLGISGVFLSMLIENIGIPAPTEIGYLVGQELVNTGKYHYWLILLVATSGHVIGSCISYSVGHWGNSAISQRILKSKRIIKVHEKLAQWYEKYGNLTVFLTRFVGYVRPWSSFVAGFAGVRFWPFFILTLTGSLIFNILNLYFANVFILVWRKFASFHLLIIIIIGLVFFGFIIYTLIKMFWARNGKK
ncbi:MAG: associated Golgi protein-like protein [Candidatus Berkelbacteria bacterium]|nr:associated Golgi protein-like protein [Candidatus Berkelbacteria bacterium]